MGAQLSWLEHSYIAPCYLLFILGQQLSWLEHGSYKAGVDGSNPSMPTENFRLTIFDLRFNMDYIWAYSSAGQSATLTLQRSSVRSGVCPLFRLDSILTLWRPTPLYFSAPRSALRSHRGASSPVLSTKKTPSLSFRKLRLGVFIFLSVTLVKNSFIFL